MGDVMIWTWARKGRDSSRTRSSAIRIVAIALGWASCLPTASAQGGILLKDGSPAQSATLATGEQLLISSHSGPFPFAGRQISLSDFAGIVGYSNELAYVVTLDGSAAIDGDVAFPGHMLIIPPYGAPISVEPFDAIRLAGKWSDVARLNAPQAYAALSRIKEGQELGVWFGRLGQTSFNVAASGSARHEKSTRTLMGHEAVRDIRFSGFSDSMAVEQLVATTFLNGLKAGDAQTVAALMDPTPFGGRGLAGGADEARLMAASLLISSHNWTKVAGTGTPELADGAWKAGDAVVQLRTIDDFVFVSGISGETK